MRQRTAELQAMVNELEHVSYAITHDMRAPLRAMTNFAQILLEEAATHRVSPEAQDYCRRIMTGASRLNARDYFVNPHGMASFIELARTLRERWLT